MAKFRTSARTVDMLGRQQIAGIPTAMSELFKNAYDAYATEVRADYFPRKALLTLRDNGVGMSEADFLARWLTLGTDSKTAGSTLTPTSIPAGMRRRQQMGEKGIGRLAIASIAPLVMVLTRATTDDGGPAAEVTAALVPWALFETPGLTLDQIDIPVVTTTGEIHDAASLLTDLVALLRSSLSELVKANPAIRETEISNQLASATETKFDNVFALDGPQISKSTGTTFILFGTGEDLEAAVVKPSEEDVVPEFQRFLGGFTNTITRPVSESPIASRFVIHRADGTFDDLIGRGTFWQRSDFDNVDHVIAGEFDDLGTFSGTVSLYRGDTIDYSLGWGSASRAPKCGPFKLTLGVLQGNPKESRLPADEFVIMSRRLRAQGGIYIYRDDIRVLPYGNSDVDYLGVEERRTLNAGRYYFSHRRMFGAVEITAEGNPYLQEKAGREGFRSNGAYRDFVAILEHFLKQIAVDFFRSGGEYNEDFQSQRNILTQRSKARAEKEKRERELRERFAAQVEQIAEMVESGRFAARVADLRTSIDSRRLELSSQGGRPEDWELLFANLRLAEQSLRDEISMRRPSSLALTAAQERDFEGAAHLADGALALLADTSDALRDAILESAKAVHASMSVEPSGRDHLVEYASDEVGTAVADAEEARGAVQEVAGRLMEELDLVVSELSLSVDGLVDDTKQTVARDRLRGREREIDTTIEAARARIQRIRESAERMFFDPDVMLDNRQLQERVLDLEEEADTNVELMQLGLAVQLVNHELENSISAVRLGLRRLQPWARANPRLNETVQDVRSAFQHLDGYLRMFTPLQRRLYRRRVTFTGSDLARFCRGVFSERLERHGVTLTMTTAFNEFQLFGYPSSFYPVFLNLIDNAIYWTQQSKRDPEIRLDASGGRLLVLDSGPGVSVTDRAAIFERGFSRRRGGRGLGLSLATEILAREGWTLTLLRPSGPLGGAEFAISQDISGENA